MDVAYHCASGKDWHGSKVTKGPVYYIAGEGHGGLARRQEAWFVNHRPNLSDIQFRYTTAAMDFHNKDKAESVRHDIEEWAKTAGNPALIVIDTLARNFNGDENSASDTGKFINNVNDYLRIPFGCVVLIVHHTGHTSKDRARGSMALKGGVDFEYRVKKNKTKPLTAELTCTKMKDAIEPEETWFEGKTIILEWPNDGDEIIDSLIFEKTDVVEQEKPLKPELTRLLELAKSLADPEGIAKNFTQVRGYISTLKDKNLIETIGTTQIRLLDQP
jgi:RecA-family ATPase